MAVIQIEMAVVVVEGGWEGRRGKRGRGEGRGGEGEGI